MIRVVSDLQPGEVATYGEVAELAGYPGRARAVGRILALTTVDLPWWRVVGSGYRIISPSPAEQMALLRREGHEMLGNRISPSLRLD